MARDFKNVKKIVVKVGTNLLSGKNGIDRARIDSFTNQIAILRERGYSVLLVTSGAIGMGRKELSLKGPVKKISLRQACAAIGQPILMSAYRESFAKHNIVCSQVLLTRDEMNNRKTYVNLRNSIETLLELGVIPVFNENDVVSTSEIGTTFGDNDRMAAMVASKIDAEMLIILSDIEGLYTADPRKNEGAEFLSEIGHIDDKIMSYAGGAGSNLGTGGMKSKLKAALITAPAGCWCIIASGYTDNVLPRILDGEIIGSCFAPEEKLSQRQRWILNNSHKGMIIVDKGAENALRNHKSLLPKGIVAVKGSFDDGDVVQIAGPEGKAFAKAVVGHSSTTIALIKGHGKSDVAAILGGTGKEVVFRPEDMIFTDQQLQSL